MILKISLVLLFLWLPLFGDFYRSHGKAQTLYPLKQSRSIQKDGIQYYQNAAGTKMGVSDTIIVGFKDGKRNLKVEKRYKLHFRKQLAPTIFLYALADFHTTLTTANTVAMDPAVAFCHPDFIIRKKIRTADPYYQYQWHLKNTDNPGADINVEEAWKYTKGEGVITAILDEGIDINHNDLRENVIGYANFNDPTSNYPASAHDSWHGTACAGLLCATENDTGVVGVAPGAKLYAVRYSDSDVAKDIEAFTYLMDKNVSVISNSWGSYSNLDAYNEIFKTLAIQGRGGKGILIFFASGNDRKNLDDPDINDESESPYVISIGASTERDNIASYNNHGSALDFLAPGGIKGGELITTDATGEKGYTDWNYNFHFTGTSASAPIAAGVGALMLSVNPDLTRDEVIDILKKSAKKIGDYDYIDGRNDYAGYGRIDAGKAVKMAKFYHQSKTISNLQNFAHVIYNSIQE